MEQARFAFPLAIISDFLVAVNAKTNKLDPVCVLCVLAREYVLRLIFSKGVCLFVCRNFVPFRGRGKFRAFERLIYKSCGNGRQLSVSNGLINIHGN